MKNLKCVKHFLGLLIAAILGIMAITAMAAIAGMALHKSIQTVNFVQEWHKDAIQRFHACSSFISQDERMSESPVETIEKALGLHFISKMGLTCL